MDMLIKSVHYHETVDYFDRLESPTIRKVIQIEMPAKTTEIEKKLWTTADSLRANSRLKASEYSVHVLGLISLRFANYRFTQVDLELRKNALARQFRLCDGQFALLKRV